jgi:hypothetical protein
MTILIFSTCTTFLECACSVAMAAADRDVFLEK